MTYAKEIRTELDVGLAGPHFSLRASQLGADDLTPLVAESRQLKGQGGRIGAPAGHHKKTFLTGNGCHRHANCFTCSLPDCRYNCRPDNDGSDCSFK